MARQQFSQEVVKFIRENENSDLASLALKKSPFEGVSIKTIVQQVQGRKTAKKKFPSLLAYDQYQYPVKESLEQASSEFTANYKAKLLEGSKFIDLTGGMGIDTYFLGKQFLESTYIEPNKQLYDLTLENFKVLGFDNCRGFNLSCEAFLEITSETYDWAYIDPSRRIDGKRKISIQNYEPNLVELYPVIQAISKNVLVKLSPMQDISECVEALTGVQRIWVISLQNEVKELLIHLKAAGNINPDVICVDISNGEENIFQGQFNDKTAKVEISSLKRYLYQPSAAIVKSGLQNSYCQSLALKKVHSNTQLYTSERLIENFQGRLFEVLHLTSLNKKIIKKVLPEMKANIISKNFPLGSSQIKAKLNLSDGGHDYLIAFTGADNKKLVAVCKRII